MWLRRRAHIAELGTSPPKTPQDFGPGTCVHTKWAMQIANVCAPERFQNIVKVTLRLAESASFFLKNSFLAMRNGVESLSQFKHYKNPWTSSHPKIRAKIANTENSNTTDSRTRICIILPEEFVSRDAEWCRICFPIQKLPNHLNECASETSSKNGHHQKFDFFHFDSTNLHLFS